MKRVVVTVFIAIVLSLLGTVRVLAQEPEIPTFDQFLLLVSGPLLSGAVAVLISFVIEYWPAYQDLDKRWKKLSFLAACLVTGVGLAALRAALGYVRWTFDPLLWHAIWNAFAAFTVGTTAHEFLPKAK